MRTKPCDVRGKRSAPGAKRPREALDRIVSIAKRDLGDGATGHEVGRRRGETSFADVARWRHAGNQQEGRAKLFHGDAGRLSDLLNRWRLSKMALDVVKRVLKIRTLHPLTPFRAIVRSCLKLCPTVYRELCRPP